MLLIPDFASKLCARRHAQKSGWKHTKFISTDKYPFLGNIEFNWYVLSEFWPNIPMFISANAQWKCVQNRCKVNNNKFPQFHSIHENSTLPETTMVANFGPEVKISPIIRMSNDKSGSVTEWLACWTQAQKGPGWFKSQSRRCRVTVLGKLFTPVMPLFTKQQNC